MAQFIRSIFRPCRSTHKRGVCDLITRPFSSHLDSDITTDDRIRNELIKLDPLEVASGMYKWDIIDRLRTDDDPYSIKAIKHGPGTKEQPNMIPSAFDSRMVGCICEEDSNTIVWMWLRKGEPKQCQCGHYFQLYYEAPIVDLPPLL